MGQDAIDDKMEELINERIIDELANFINENVPNEHKKNQELMDSIKNILEENIEIAIEMVDDAIEDVILQMEAEAHEILDTFEVFDPEWNEEVEVAASRVSCNTCGDPEPINEKPKNGTIEVDWNSELDWK
jgi:hypothetical protein